MPKAILYGVYDGLDLPQGATLNRSSMPGSAKSVQSRKNPDQPIDSTSQPVAALAKVRGIAARLVKSANCVAV